MVDTAARLVDQVLPPVPIRQWVLSLPFEVRYRLADDGRLMSAVLGVFLRLLSSWYRRQARAQGHPHGHTGAVTFVPRFGSALNLNPHLHGLMPDGLWAAGPAGEPPSSAYASRHRHTCTAVKPHGPRPARPTPTVDEPAS